MSSNHSNPDASQSLRATRSSATSPVLAVQAVCFACGLATSFAMLGVASALAGRAYGSLLGSVAPAVVGAVAIVMGLNLLEVRWMLPHPPKPWAAVSDRWALGLHGPLGRKRVVVAALGVCSVLVVEDTAKQSCW